MLAQVAVLQDLKHAYAQLLDMGLEPGSMSELLRLLDMALVDTTLPGSMSELLQDANAFGSGAICSKKDIAHAVVQLSAALTEARQRACVQSLWIQGGRLANCRCGT